MSYHGNELAFHLRKALDMGVTQDEIITHLTCYSGWPTASSALSFVREVFQQEEDV
ncbi:carboxymuconolactone decarboxylase family protein [Asaia astilbis]|uniref:carboxymuconolactone decarboxylase family protein n=1 Tax=Asaia astilbis TaxID=610244 RepID=UPI0009FF6D03